MSFLSHANNSSERNHYYYYYLLPLRFAAQTLNLQTPRPESLTLPITNILTINRCHLLSYYVPLSIEFIIAPYCSSVPVVQGQPVKHSGFSHRHCPILQFSTCSTGIASKTFWLLSQTHFSAVARHPKIEFIFFARPKIKGKIITKCWYNHQVRHQGITIRSDTWV